MTVRLKPLLCQLKYNVTYFLKTLPYTTVEIIRCSGPTLDTRDFSFLLMRIHGLDSENQAWKVSATQGSGLW